MDAVSVTIRRGRATDVQHLAALMFEQPSPEVVGLAPDLDRFREYRSALFRRSGEPRGWANFLVADLDDEVVGFAETGTAEPSLAEMGSSAVQCFGVLGSIQAVWRSWPRALVEHRAPAGAFHIVELQVGVSARNQGIGGMLVEASVQLAQDDGHGQVSLTTATNNPARRLYERFGFSVVATRTNLAYERRTGAAGRVLMVKEL